MNHITEKMRRAGSDVASDITNAQVSKYMDGFGGSKTYAEWVEDSIPNKDLVIAYLNNEIDSVTAIYIAMERAKE